MRSPALSFGNNPAFHDLLRAVATAPSITIVCGAGVSSDAGLPSWHGLLKRLAQQRMEEGSRLAEVMLTDDSDLTRRAGLILRSPGTANRVPDYAGIASALYRGIATHSSSLLAQNIARLCILSPERLALVTTNFDDILESALVAEEFPEVVPCSLQNVNEWWQAFENPSPPSFHVLHLHGYLGRSSQLGPLILTEDQFLEHGSRVREELTRIFEQSAVVLLLGMSLADPNIVGTLASRPSNENIFMISVPGPEAKMSVTDAFDYHVVREGYLEELFGLRIVRLNSYAQVSQIVAEVATYIGAPDAYESNDPDTSTRYGFRLHRSLRRAYEKMWGEVSAQPSALALAHASDLLFEVIDDTKKALLDLLMEQPDATIRRVRDRLPPGWSLRDYVFAEGLALFLWLPSVFDLEDRTRREFCLRLVASSAYSHREYWSFDRPTLISWSEPSTVSRVAFSGRATVEPSHPAAEPRLWHANVCVPVELSDPASDVTVHVGVLTLSTSKALEADTPTDTSVISLLDGERSAKFLKFLAERASELLR